MKRFITTLMLIFAVTALSACATLNSLTSTQTVIANEVLTLGAELYIQKAGGTVTAPALYSPEQQARAQKLYNAAIEINGFASGTVTLTQLDAALAKWAASLPTPLEQGLAAGLIAEINALLATRISTGVLNAAQVALVTEVTNDWIVASKAYGAVGTAKVRRGGR